MMKKKLNVLYIITKLELGGAQKVCLSLLTGLEKSNDNSFLISGAEGPLTKNVANKKNIFLLNSFIRELSPKAIFKEIKTFVLLIKTIRKLKKKHPDLIVHTHSTKAGLLGRWAALFAGVKKRVHTIHGYGFNEHQPKIIWAAIYILELVTSLITTHFICVSKKDAETGTKLFPNFYHKHSIIHAAVNWDNFYQPAKLINENNKYQAARLEETIIFGTISCLKKQKNLFDLLQAFKNVHKRHLNAQLEIVGDGILRSKIEQWIKNNSLNHAITLHGWQKNVSSIAQRWHALVMTSLWEGLPCTVVEARLLSIPVISYKTGGIPEVIINGKNGLLYKQKNWPGIADGMNKLIEDPKLHRQLKQYSDNLEMFKNKTMVEKHVHLYHHIS